MKTPLLLLLFSLMIASPSSCKVLHSLRKGSSLHVEKNDVLVSPSGLFSAGFHSVGNNAFCFAIWFTNFNSTIVWTANRDQPVNGIDSTLSLLGDGNLVLTDAGRNNVWITNTPSASSMHLKLMDTGNLVLQTSESVVLWQSFENPTDTLLPEQKLTRTTKLISSRSRGNRSSGFYSLFFDNDNVLRLLFDGPAVSSIYWPLEDPVVSVWDMGRTTYNNSRVASFNSLGHFQSSDGLSFFAADLGIGPKRRLTLDVDGNLRLYSLDEKEGKWQVSWQALSKLCKVHGLCGPNSLCIYQPERRCVCLPGYKVKDATDPSRGCELEVNITYDDLNDIRFLAVPHIDFYGQDRNFTRNTTLEDCKTMCLQFYNECMGFMYRTGENGLYSCYAKSLLLNGFGTPDFVGTMYLKLQKNAYLKMHKDVFQFYNEPARELELSCSSEIHVQLPRVYKADTDPKLLHYLLWFSIVIGGVEMICVLLGWCYLFRTQDNSSIIQQGYLFAATGFRKFTYAELKKATEGFSEEIGRGGGGVVYKGKLPDGRNAAIKKLNEFKQEEGEFFAEVSTIGRINHMNLIEMWGFCAERNHRILVFEYMERGSLAENLSSGRLDWEKRFEIALGTAKGLAYLHEECLEWVLHCDVKPQNILLDANFMPKVADFGLSKLLDRTKTNHSNFSAIRGTRGYMAPEWVYNLPITSKVDVYSYGVVMLELITGKSPTELHAVSYVSTEEHLLLVNWVREKMNGDIAVGSKIKEITDSSMDDQYDVAKMENLITVALLCVEEDIDARPTMSQVVHMLMSPKKGQ